MHIFLESHYYCRADNLMRPRVRNLMAPLETFLVSKRGVMWSLEGIVWVSFGGLYVAVIRDPSLFCYTTYFLVYLTNQFSSQLKKRGSESQDFSLPPRQGHVRYRAGFTCLGLLSQVSQGSLEGLSFSLLKYQDSTNFLLYRAAVNLK